VADALLLAAVFFLPSGFPRCVEEIARQSEKRHQSLFSTRLSASDSLHAETWCWSDPTFLPSLLAHEPCLIDKRRSEQHWNERTIDFGKFFFAEAKRGRVREKRGATRKDREWNLKEQFSLNSNEPLSSRTTIAGKGGAYSSEPVVCVAAPLTVRVATSGTLVGIARSTCSPLCRDENRTRHYENIVYDFLRVNNQKVVFEVFLFKMKLQQLGFLFFRSLR